MESIFLWRLCETLTIPQAALLMIGCDPENLECEVEITHGSKPPEGYGPCKAALISAIAEGKVNGKLMYYDSDFSDEKNLSVIDSSVEVGSLKDWLLEKGFHEHFFFFPDGVEREFLDSDHPRYAPKLAAAVTAWRAFDDPEAQKAKTPKQAIMKWLRENARRFELSDEDGNPIESAIEEVAKIANWQPKGGAPTTPNGTLKPKKVSKSTLLSITGPKFTPKQEPNGYELDDDIPF